MENWAGFDSTFKKHRQLLWFLLQELSCQAGRVTLSAGGQSDFYLDCKRTVLTAGGHYHAGWLILRLLSLRAPTVRAVGGLGLGAYPLASAVSALSYSHNIFRAYAKRRPIDAFYIRQEPKPHGTRAWIEGKVEPGTRVAILEDVVTTGASTLRAFERTTDYGLQVETIIALVDREEGGRQNIETKSGVPLFAFFCRSDFAMAEK